jgi:hypothetical protein
MVVQSSVSSSSIRRDPPENARVKLMHANAILILSSNQARRWLPIFVQLRKVFP